MWTKSIADQYSRPILRSILGLWVKHVLDPVQADSRIRIPCLGMAKMPSRSGIRRSVHGEGFSKLLQHTCVADVKGQVMKLIIIYLGHLESS